MNKSIWLMRRGKWAKVDVPEVETDPTPRWVKCLIVLCFGVVVITALAHQYELHNKKNDDGVLFINGVAGQFIAATTPSRRIDSSPLPPPDADSEAAFYVARKAWEASLGRELPFKITLRVGRLGDCSSNEALACIEHIGGTHVTMIRSMFADGQTDKMSVFMHEIGHALGVPHIEDDSLMAPVFNGKLEKPSDFAVAIAKICVEKFRKGSQDELLVCN